MNTERIVRIHGDDIDVVYSDGTKLRIGDTTAGQASDTYHSLDDLYRHRLLLTAALFNSWHAGDSSNWLQPHKSWRHSDGEPCFGGGWFIVVAQLPTGQISYHYPAKDWDLFRITDRLIPADFDGHTADDVVDRLDAYLRPA